MSVPPVGLDESIFIIVLLVVVVVVVDINAVVAVVLSAFILCSS